MRHGQHDTADAIERMDDMVNILRDLSIYPAARAVVVDLQWDVNEMRDTLVTTFMIADQFVLKRIRKLERRVNRVDAIYRPLG